MTKYFLKSYEIKKIVFLPYLGGVQNMSQNRQHVPNEITANYSPTSDIGHQEFTLRSNLYMHSEWTLWGGKFFYFLQIKPFLQINIFEK